jgi:hypothetical protein
MRVTIKATSIQFDDREMPYPVSRDKLFETLGQPERTIDRGAIQIFVWDDLGFFVFYLADEYRTRDITFIVQRVGVETEPRKLFRGTIVVDEVGIASGTSEAELQQGGFDVKSDSNFHHKCLGPTAVYAEFDDLASNNGRLRAVAFSVGCPRKANWPP